MQKDKKDESNEKQNKGDQKPSKEPIAEGEPLIPISMSEYDGLQKQISTLQTQADEYLDGMQRERANFANYKKRMDQDSLNTYSNALAEVTKNYIVVIDDLERALKNRPSDETSKPWVDGIDLIYQKLKRSIESQGIIQFRPEAGDEFDPNLFEAVTHEDHETYQNGQVIEVLQPGYKIKERIIRPALVRVAK